MKPIRIDGLLMKEQPVAGTDAVPTAAANGVQLEEHVWSGLDIDFLERNERQNATGRGFGRNTGGQPAGRFVKFTAVQALKGAAAAATLPEIDVPCRCSGLIRTNASPAVGQRTYAAPNTSDVRILASAYIYAAGMLYKLIDV